MYKIVSIIFFLSSINLLAQTSSTITIEQIRAKYDCRGCPGSLLVKNEDKVDTIFVGQWGNDLKERYKDIK